MRRVKQVILVRKDLGMSKGKIASQVAHASQQFLIEEFSNYRIRSLKGSLHELESIVNPNRFDILEDWLKTGYTKICLAVDSLEDLEKSAELAKKQGTRHHFIIDEGRTEIEENTKTCLSVGPDFSQNIDNISHGFKLL